MSAQRPLPPHPIPRQMSRARLTLAALAWPLPLTAASLLLGACAGIPAQAPASSHLQKDSLVKELDKKGIPTPVLATPTLQRPKAAAKTETYSVSVRNIPAQELLFALSRDAKLNIDLHPGIEGSVTINAIDQTLQQILNRVSKQVDMRWEIDGPNLVVLPDTPYLKTYTIDYVNLTRDMAVKTEVSSQVSSGGDAGGGSAITKIETSAKNRFWETLEKNIKDILHETDKILPEGSSETTVESNSSTNASVVGNVSAKALSALTGNGAKSTKDTGLGQGETSAANTGATVVRKVNFREAASVIANPESGILAVRATSRQQEKIQEFLDKVATSARRQVMIEATIVEVELSDSYKQGIEWSRFRSDGTTRASGTGFSITPETNNSATATPFSLSFLGQRNGGGLDLSVTVNLLEKFGNVKVLSSPKLSVLNNQTAMLNVVENVVYFAVKSDVATGTIAGAAPVKAITTTAKSVAVGLMMQVTPQISENGSITLNVRPSITSISKSIQDPNPDIPSNIGNAVPQIKTREMESVMRVLDGEIAVLGGLMKEEANYDTGRVPGVGAIPFLGELFTRRDDARKKSELVIFLRPVIVNNYGSNGEFSGHMGQLPTANFFEVSDKMKPFGTLTTSGTSSGASRP